MQSTLSEWIQLSANTAGVFIVVYWIVEIVRNWNGTPELKALRDQMLNFNKHMDTLHSQMANHDTKLFEVTQKLIQRK
ncbi:MAG: hypothetical protein P3T54_08385 [Dehalogenimonas sp.]|uniref:Uncharacterized protein n=1 Tax=Candidatus Dehalogenimonas loeffleri TaxID=3127115 RepID=A0ABZ2J3B2_9CHLR|nr:hypothetical protein [Dehalogenimonas sp.]